MYVQPLSGEGGSRKRTGYRNRHGNTVIDRNERVDCDLNVQIATPLGPNVGGAPGTVEEALRMVVLAVGAGEYELAGRCSKSSAEGAPWRMAGRFNRRAPAATQPTRRRRCRRIAPHHALTSLARIGRAGATRATAEALTRWTPARIQRRGFRLTMASCSRARPFPPALPLSREHPCVRSPPAR
jgi:hypothetical protein